MEKLRISAGQIATRARRAETDLVDAIERSGNSDGNIGKLAKTALKRLPSSVYWQGLSVWGIRVFQGAQAQYHGSLDRYYSRVTRLGGRVSKRDIEHDDLVAPNWHGGLVSPPPDYPANCSLSLTRPEAEYLAERIRLSPTTAGSLLAELVAQRRRNDDVPFIWEHPYSAELPPKLGELVHHAGCFSEVMHGAPLLYNLVLAEQAHWDEGVGKYRQRFAEWEQLISKRSKILIAWKRTRFWELIRAVNPRISNPTYDFINT
jgi:Family of unknown function (DUF6361)